MHVNGIAQQFGLATTPSCSRARSPFTSGTTSGTPGSSRYADDLSTTTAPPRTACGTSSRDADVPTENNASSTPADASASGVASSTTIPQSSVRPAERADANARTFSWPRSRSSRMVPAPTAPVAPPTAMLPSGTDALLGEEPELLVHGAHGTLDVAGAHDARHADGGRGDDLDVDARVGERLEHVGGDAGMALHARADEGNLRDVGVVRDPPRADLLAEPLERRLCSGKIRLRQRERDVGRTVSGAVLHDHVDVDACICERAEHARGDARAVRH